MNSLKDIPAHLWLLALSLFLLLAWEIRPDAVVQNLLMQAIGAYLTSLVPAVRNALNAPQTTIPTVQQPTPEKQ